MTKLSLSQIEDSYELEDDASWRHAVGDEVEDLPSLDRDIDEAAFRNTYQRKEIRTKRKREEGELVGTGGIRKHRKY